MNDMLMRGGKELPSRTVVGYRARYSTNGSYHRIDALLYIAAHTEHVTTTSYQIEREIRPTGWTTLVPVYIGLHGGEAAEAEARVQQLWADGATLTE